MILQSDFERIIKFPTGFSFLILKDFMAASHLTASQMAHCLNPSNFTIQLRLTKNRVGGIHCDLVLGSITDQSFGISKGDIAWGGSVPLIIGNYFHLSVLKDTHTRIGGAKINANCRSFRHGC